MEPKVDLIYLYSFIAILSSFLLYQTKRRQARSAPFPPGPRPLPLIGNLQDMTKTKLYKKFGELAKKHGKIVHINILGKHLIVLNDPKYVTEILESKSRLYSERPVLTMAGKLVGWDGATALRPFDNQWAKQRRLMANFLGTRVKVAEFENVINEAVKKLLANIVTSPEKQLSHFQHYAGFIILMLVYGYKINDQNDHLVKIVNDAVTNFAETTRYGAYAVDGFPILQIVPSWFPGASWKKKVIKYREQVKEMLERPYNWTREQMKLGTARPCFLTDMLDAEFSEKRDRVFIQWTAATIYAAGVHTTAGAMSCFLLGAIRHSDKLQRARAEIEGVVGNDRLPTLADRPHLPYVEALCMEIHRWYTVIPLGFHHVSREDDIHDGYFIPKGSLLLANNMLFYRDETLYPNPNEFSPERFLEYDADGRRKQKDPRDFLFGYGRRSCPGNHLADAMLWLASAAFIAVFDMKPIVEDGKPTLPSPEFLGDVISHPEPFDCVITPRSKAAEALLQGLSL